MSGILLLPQQFIRFHEHEHNINVGKTSFVSCKPKKSDSCDTGNDISATCFIHYGMLIYYVYNKLFRHTYQWSGMLLNTKTDALHENHGPCTTHVHACNKIHLVINGL